jgi:hypothetical protein
MRLFICLVLSALFLATPLTAQNTRSLRFVAQEDRFKIKADCVVQGDGFTKSFKTPKAVRLPLKHNKRFAIDRLTRTYKGQSISMDYVPSKLTRLVFVSFPKPGKPNISQWHSKKDGNVNRISRTFLSGPAVSFLDSRGKTLFFFFKDSKGQIVKGSANRYAVE